jgi:hypothetical protein
MVSANDDGGGGGAASRLREMIDRKGIRSVLITNLRLSGISGTELIVVDFAELLRKCGCDVHVCATSCAPPVADLLQHAGATCHSIKSDPFLSKLPKQFDLIIGHHWVVLSHVLLEGRTAFRSLLLASYSQAEPNEVIWLFREQADRIVFNSQSNHAIQTNDWPESLAGKSIVFPNSVPADWLVADQPGAPERDLASVLIISNHAPPELLAAAAALRKDGIVVDHVGRPMRSERVSKELVDRYDLVVTIGHSAQKAMARGKPVYIYDHFGGCGWIGDRLLEQANNNFSGVAGGALKTSERLRTEIRDGFRADAARAGERLAFVRQQCRLEDNLMRALGDVEPGEPRRIAAEDNFIASRLSCMQLSAHMPEHAKFGVMSNVTGRKRLERLIAAARGNPRGGEIRFTMEGLPREVRVGEDIRDITIIGQLFDPRDPFSALVFVRDDGLLLEAQHGLPTPGLVGRFDRAPFAGSAGFRANLAIVEQTSSFEIVARRISGGSWSPIGALSVSRPRSAGRTAG